MTHSLELLLDDGADARLRAEWDALAAAGLPSQARHRGASNRPHVTLAVRAELPTAVEVALPVEVLLGSPLVLGAGERRTVARLVVPSTALMARHAALHDQLGAGADAPFTAPGRWTPHVTLARRVPLADLGRALERLEPREFAATLVGLRHWDGVARIETRVA